MQLVTKGAWGALTTLAAVDAARFTLLAAFWPMVGVLTVTGAASLVTLNRPVKY